MGEFSIWHWLIVLAIVVMVFGTKKLKNIGSDLGEAVKGFKQGMKSAEEEAQAPAQAQAQAPAQAQTQAPPRVAGADPAAAAAPDRAGTEQQVQDVAFRPKG